MRVRVQKMLGPTGSNNLSPILSMIVGIFVLHSNNQIQIREFH